MIRTAGGTFDRHAPPLFFLAGGHQFVASCPDRVERYRYLMIALNDLNGSLTERMEGWLDRGAAVMLDSGIFALATAHMRAHAVSMADALALPPEGIDGFEAHIARYVDVCRRLGPRLWGYVELDQGGPDSKRRLRGELEAAGLRPIPVYHPLNDGWDYLDELLERYDRICIGNIARIFDETLRSRLLLTIWERARRAKRRPWIHVLGYTPNPRTVALPFDSYDSSEYLYALQYGAYQNKGRAMTGHFSAIGDPAFSYDRRADAESTEARGERKGKDFAVYIARADLESLQRIYADRADALGERFDRYPKPHRLEPALRR